jgi:hypothetical protein
MNIRDLIGSHMNLASTFPVPPKQIVGGDCAQSVATEPANLEVQQ